MADTVSRVSVAATREDKATMMAADLADQALSRLRIEVPQR